MFVHPCLKITKQSDFIMEISNGDFAQGFIFTFNSSQRAMASTQREREHFENLKRQKKEEQELRESLLTAEELERERQEEEQRASHEQRKSDMLARQMKSFGASSGSKNAILKGKKRSSGSKRLPPSGGMDITSKPEVDEDIALGGQEGDDEEVEDAKQGPGSYSGAEVAAASSSSGAADDFQVSSPTTPSRTHARTPPRGSGVGDAYATAAARSSVSSASKENRGPDLPKGHVASLLSNVDFQPIKFGARPPTMAPTADDDAAVAADVGDAPETSETDGSGIQFDHLTVKRPRRSTTSSIGSSGEGGGGGRRKSPAKFGIATFPPLVEEVPPVNSGSGSSPGSGMSTDQKQRQSAAEDVASYGAGYGYGGKQAWSSSPGGGAGDIEEGGAPQTTKFYNLELNDSAVDGRRDAPTRCRDVACYALLFVFLVGIAILVRQYWT